MVNYNANTTEINQINPAILQMIKRNEIKLKNNNLQIKPKFEQQFEFAYYGFTDKSQIKQTINRLTKELNQLNNLLNNKTYTLTEDKITEIKMM